eukprot:315521-Prymnesium_polylepis.2
MPSNAFCRKLACSGRQQHGGQQPVAAHLHGVRLAVLRELFEHRVRGLQPLLVLLRLVVLDDRLEQSALLGRQPILARTHAEDRTRDERRHVLGGLVGVGEGGPSPLY